MSEIRVAVIGTGVIGRTHIETLKAVPGMALTAVVDPSPASRDLADTLQIRHFTTTDDLLAAKMADAVVTPASRLSVYERSAIFLGPVARASSVGLR